MPWKETDAMDQREEFVKRARVKTGTMRALCEEFGITPKTGYKWLNRVEDLGAEGLAERSRRPHSANQQLDEWTTCEIVRLKGEHPHWGPTKLLTLFKNQHPTAKPPSLSSVKRVLGRCGLVQRRQRRPAAPGGRISTRFEPTAPNQLWTVDFKGWWYTTTRRKVVPLTVCDAFSRFILDIRVVPDGKTATIQACFETLFEHYGLPLAIRSDNGSPFASWSAPLGLSQLSVWWLALGINLDRIRPGHPEENGRHERMHRNLALEVEGQIDGDLHAQQAALDVWRDEFNLLRPHAALDQRTPAELYRSSERRYDPQRLAPEYPLGYWRRKVSSNGCIKLGNSHLLLTTALRGWEVGLQPLDSARFKVWFGELCLGELNVRDETFRVASRPDPGVMLSPHQHYHPIGLLPMSQLESVTDV